MKNKVLQAGILSLILAAGSQANTVKVSFGYTKNIKNANGGVSNTKAKISDRYIKSQNAQKNCQSGITISGAGIFQTSYNTSNQTAETQLIRLAGQNSVKDLRDYADTKKGDLVQLYCQFTDTDITGLAQIAKRFSIVKDNQLSFWTHYTQTTSAHETGHNLNAYHGTGYCLSNNKRTIMADSRDCSSNYWNIFSSSSKWHKNVKLGDNSHNTREVMVQRAPTAANYR